MTPDSAPVKDYDNPPKRKNLTVAAADLDAIPLYLVLIADRHTDVDVQPFSTEQLAVDAARQAVRNLARHQDAIEWDAELNDAMRRDGWVFYVPYSGEGDCVRVVRRFLDRDDT